MTSHVLHKIGLEEQEWNALREKLQEIHDLPEGELVDTLDGETKLLDLLAAAVLEAQDLSAQATAAEELASSMSARAARFSAASDKIRAAVFTVMERHDIKKLTAPNATISLRAGRDALGVIDESRIPLDWFKPQPSKLDKVRLLAALKEGQEIDGALLRNGAPSLSIRTK